MMRLITVCVLVIAAWPPVAEAQEASSALEALHRARAATQCLDLRHRRDGTTLQGEGHRPVRHVADGRNPGRRYEHRDFRDPSNRASDSIANGILIGLGLAVAGTFLSCGIESAANEYCYGTAYAFWPILGVGAFVGAMVDATRHKTLYEAADAKRVTVAPAVSRAGLSVRASIEW